MLELERKYQRLEEDYETECPPDSESDLITIKVLKQEKSAVITGLTLSSTVRDLKEGVQREYKIPIDQQRLIFCGKPLGPDERFLHTFQIKNESVVHLFPRPSPSSSASSSSAVPTTTSSNEETLNPLDIDLQIPGFTALHHLPIHFDPQVGQSIREVRMWCYILVIISTMTLFSNLTFLGSTGRAGNGFFDGVLNVIESICSVFGLYIGQIGLKSSVTVDLSLIKHYVLLLTILAAVMIMVRVLWIADVVLLAEKDLKEKEDEANDDGEKDEGSRDDGLYDDYVEDEMSDHNFLIYFGIQATIMAGIIISLWVTCVMRAYRFRTVVEAYEGITRGGQTGVAV